MIKKIIYSILGILSITIASILLYMGPLLKDYLTMDVISGGDGIFYIMDYGGNSGLIIGDSAAVLIDTKMGGGSKKLHKFVQAEIGEKKLHIVNTHHHTDHTSGNKLYSDAIIYAGNYGEELWLGESKSESLPSEWIEKNTSIDLGGKVVEIIPIGANHTKKDLFIYSSDHRVLFTGDVYCHLSHPVIKPGSEPNIDQWEETLRAYAENKELDVMTVIPGHGDLAKKEDLFLMADYFSNIKTLSKKNLKKKYRQWTKLPFLATMNRSLKYIEVHYKEAP